MQPLSARRGVVSSLRAMRHIGARCALFQSVANPRQEFRGDVCQVGNDARFEDLVLLSG